ncbi:MAG: CsbD family protein [Alphaproteobacteria bacterium]|nr:CsbD family protein [Alphaproteobacteria bacterium]
MDWNGLSGDWVQGQERVRRRWDKLTDEDLAYIAGNRAHFVARVQDRYQMTREEVELHLKNWLATEMA